MSRRSSVLDQCTKFSKKVVSNEFVPILIDDCDSHPPQFADLPAPESYQWAQGLVITGTGFHGPGRQHIRQAAEQAGAVYRGDLTQGVTTHLACRSVSSAEEGDKYRRAAQWGIPAISWLWLHQSTLARRKLPLDSFYSDVGAEAATSRSKNPPQGPTPLRPCHSREENLQGERQSAKAPAPSHESLGAPFKSSAMAAGRILQEVRGGGGSALDKENVEGRTANTDSKLSSTLPLLLQPQSQQAAGSLPSQPRQTAPDSVTDAANIADLTIAVSDINLGGSCPAAAPPLDHAEGDEGNSPRGSSVDMDGPQSPSSNEMSGGSSELDIQCGQRMLAPSMQCLPSPPGDAMHDGSHSTGSTLQGVQYSMPSSPKQSAEDFLPTGDLIEHAPFVDSNHIGAANPLSEDVLAEPSPHLGRAPEGSSQAISLWGTPTDFRHHVTPSAAPDAALPGVCGVHALKVLARQARGNTVKDFHGLLNLKRVQFAEQLQLVEPRTILTTKDKRTCVELRSLPLYGEVAETGDASADAQLAEIIAEIQAMYQLPSGEWWVECCRFFSARDIGQLAAETNESIPLPFGFDKRCEMLRGVNRLHYPASDVTGTRQVRKSKQAASTVSRVQRDGMFWRSCFNTDLLRCVTDAPVQTFAL